MPVKPPPPLNVESDPARIRRSWSRNRRCARLASHRQHTQPLNQYILGNDSQRHRCQVPRRCATVAAGVVRLFARAPRSCLPRWRRPLACSCSTRDHGTGRRQAGGAAGGCKERWRVRCETPAGQNQESTWRGGCHSRGCVVSVSCKR